MTNLLLLLSAMLSALIGAGPVGRVVQVPVAVSSAAHARVVPEAAQDATVRPLAALPTVAALIGMGVIVVLFVPVAVPVWTTRRRQ